MLKTCRAGPGSVSLSVEKGLKILIKFDHPGPVGQNGNQIFDRPIFHLFDAP